MSGYRAQGEIREVPERPGIPNSAALHSGYVPALSSTRLSPTIKYVARCAGFAKNGELDRMPKYMIEVNYVGAGIKGLLKDGGTTRREIVEQMMSELGCKLESFYYAMGPTDLYIIVDGPDNVTALAGTMTAAASGMVTCRTIPLFTAEQMDAVARKWLVYQAPGQ